MKFNEKSFTNIYRQTGQFSKFSQQFRKTIGFEKNSAVHFTTFYGTKHVRESLFGCY